MANTTILNSRDQVPVLKPGQIFRVEPLRSNGFFLFPRDQVPIYLPPVQVNLATQWTQSLPALVDTGNQSTLKSEITALDMNPGYIAQYWLRAVDNVYFTIYQPGANSVMQNRAGVIRFGRGSGKRNRDADQAGKVPQVFVLEDKTRPTIEAMNTTYRATYFARFEAEGFAYPIVKIEDQETIDRLKREEIPALTIKTNYTGGN